MHSGQKHPWAQGPARNVTVPAAAAPRYVQLAPWSVQAATAVGNDISFHETVLIGGVLSTAAVCTTRAGLAQAH